ncbi:MAG TPA: efflux RND transporter permease subunit [Steroidobacteraceae bacterium]|nr:efflux RND transporter permease subunit [Steroidobacteraceae bacterium]
MSSFTDIFIQRPVLATVVSLMVLVLGLRAAASLPIRQFPKTENATVTVTTQYFGASADLVAGFITTPIESAVAEAQGIDYLTSDSVMGTSTVTAVLRLNYDANRAQSEISSKVNSVLNQLPTGTQQPVITVQVGEQNAGMYIGFSSETVPANQITDYVIRVAQPKLQAVAGVQRAEILGARQYALRAWLDPVKLAANGVSAADVAAALQDNNYLSALGTTKGQMVSVDLKADTDLHSAQEFRNLVVKQKAGGFVRLGDLGNVVLGAEDYESEVAFKGKGAVFVGIHVAPEANILTVMGAIRKLFPEIQGQLPGGMHAQIGYDATGYINAAIRDVVKTLIETLLIVTLVIFLFLGSVRSVIVPVIAMPLSLIGAFFIMLMLGYSINLLTLLALVLAIGLVVDDAIIVVENVDRHLKEGASPLQAALQAARELGGPIIAMTIVLVAAYVPIGLQGGLTGALFTQFAFTLAGAVTVSAIIALTLSPMMCAKVFRSEQEEGRFTHFLDRTFNRLRDAYLRTLSSWLTTWGVVVVFGALILPGVVYLFMTSKAELAPQEDQGIVLEATTGPPDATLTQMQSYSDAEFAIARKLPEYQQMFQLTGAPTVNQGFGGVLFKTWDQRHRSAAQLQMLLQNEWNKIPGARVAAFQFPALPGSQGFPIQFVITTTEPIENLNEVATQVLDKARSSGMFWFVDSDLKLDKPQQTVNVDRDMVSDLGLTQQNVGGALAAALGGGYVNYFSIAGRSYKVIPQVLQVDRLNPDQVLDYQLHSGNGTLIPARTIASLKTSTVPETIGHFQQLNATTIGGVSAVAEADALKFLRNTLKQVAPTGYNADYSGESRQYMLGSGSFVFTLLFALTIVYLALAAQFESFRDPAVILVSVPMALFGALIFINLGVLGLTLNIYTQVGLVTLLGLVSKHGILIVQFANELQRAGHGKLAAIEEAAAVRLRPILMTTAAMCFGVIPLVIASGAGAAGRRNMGVVLFTGLAIGTLFTLFVVPAMYMFIGADHEHEARARGHQKDGDGRAPEPVPAG